MKIDFETTAQAHENHHLNIVSITLLQFDVIEFIEFFIVLHN